MDPSLSISTEPSSLPPKFFPFNSAVTAASNPGVFGGGGGGSVHNHEAPLFPNPSHLPPHPIFHHPSYAEMIRTAIQTLNEKDGSSKQAISRFIERTYSGLPPAHSALLAHHLKTLKNCGVLVLVKKSYMLSSPGTGAGSGSGSGSGFLFSLDASRSGPEDNYGNPRTAEPPTSATVEKSLPIKRGRGRPPKLKPQPHTPNPAPDSASNPTPVPNPTFSGSPSPGTLQQFNPDPAVKSNGQASWEQHPESLSAPVPVKRGRGRPRKNTTPVVGSAMSQGPDSSAKQPVRKPKYASEEPKPTEYPAYQNVTPPIITPRPRGRPRKNPPSTAFTATQPLRESASVTASGKRRGRPPKMVGVITKPMKPTRRSSGRPVGRPRKYPMWNSTGPTESRYQHLYEDARRKLEFFQNKVKQAIAVLRPQTDRNNFIVMSVMQELDGLVAMDLNMTEEESRPPQEAEMEPEVLREPPVLQEAQLF